VRPQDRSGVVVKFPVTISHGALLRLVDEAGAAVPLGSTARLRATGSIVPVGYDGEAYVQDLSPHNELAVEQLNGRRCRVVFDYHPIPGQIPTIGPLRCAEK
jgi:outer membrane usher protein